MKIGNRKLTSCGWGMCCGGWRVAWHGVRVRDCGCCDIWQLLLVEQPDCIAFTAHSSFACVLYCAYGPHFPYVDIFDVTFSAVTCFLALSCNQWVRCCDVFICHGHHCHAT